VGIAVTGALLLMAGVLLGFASQVMGLPGGKPTLGVVAGGLIVAGLACGVLLIAASRPLSARPGKESGRPGKPSGGPGKRRKAAPDVQLPAGTVGPPGTSEEWIRNLRR
jgi:hypothetical protein